MWADGMSPLLTATAFLTATAAGALLAGAVPRGMVPPAARPAVAAFLIGAGIAIALLGLLSSR